MLSDLIQLRCRHEEDETVGMVSVCSVHPKVIEAAMAAHRGRSLLVEVTPNQVNPEGGYSGMTPADFSRMVLNLAEINGFPTSRLILGADHLGPHVWKQMAAQAALAKTAEMARQCVAAGFQKIHLDTAVACADDEGPGLDLEKTARRAAQLCLEAEKAAETRALKKQLVYVIGQDVPQPGGGLERGRALRPTTPQELIRTLEIFEHVFATSGLASAWQRVVAVVVQPGVDFNDLEVAEYQPDRVAALSDCHSRLPGMMTFEAHAADYQPPGALKNLVRDHFCLLKVGPCLTYAFREAVFALARLEEAWHEVSHKSNLLQVMDQLMRADPRHLTPLQLGGSDRARRLRQTSLRDRIRYYWSRPRAQASFGQLLHNLDRPIPHDLLLQFLPDLDNASRQLRPGAILLGQIRKALEPYMDACR